MAGDSVAFTVLQRAWVFQENKKNEELGKALTETPSKITCNFSFDGVSWCEGFSSFFSLNITDISESLYTYS